MIAALPMYWFPETRDAHVAFWAIVRDALRDAGLAAPDALTETADLPGLWGAGDLVLSHICNLPYRLSYRDRLTRIAASDYGLEGCPPGHYRSLFVTRRDHPADAPWDGAALAINEPDSQSGWGAPAAWAAAHGLRFRPVRVTGSHHASIRAVAAGQADLAAIDARSFAIHSEIEPATARLKVIGATDPSPGMTFVTRAGEDPAPYLAAIRAGIAGIDDRHRHWLGLRDAIVLEDAAYDLALPPDPRAWAA